MQFKDIIGLHETKRQLMDMFHKNRVGHALLLSSKSGWGALPMAVAYATYLNCTGDKRNLGDSCAICPSCVKMNSLLHADVNYIYPVNSSKSSIYAGAVSKENPVSDHFIKQWREIFTETNGYFDEQTWYKKIGIENKQGIISRYESGEIIRKLSLKPIEGGYKVIIMWLPERMNDASANTLLKIFEEPWDKTLFILVSEQPEKLLSTVISRMQIISIPMPDRNDIANYIATKFTLDPSEAESISKVCLGSVVMAESLVENRDETGDFFELFTSLMRLCYSNSHLALIEWAEKVSALGREGQKQFVRESVRMLRETYMLNMGMPSITSLYGEELSFCKKFSPFVNNINIESLIAEFELLQRHIIQNGNPKIIFTHFALTISKLIGK